jgi:nitrite reductase/ring-hydroxylating ferredoxin subunit
LIYSDGVAVGRHRRGGSLPDDTLRFSSSGLPTEARDLAAGLTFVATIPADQLHDKDSVRVQVDNEVLVLAKLEGNYYALQEFCTHRFGPLSEGSFRNDQVQCPWHGSCFDVRTGRVTQGPAKVGLKTYPVQVRDGKVCIGLPKPSAGADEIDGQRKAA